MTAGADIAQILGRGDVVLAVAIRTDRDIIDSLGVILAVDALQIISFDPHMTLAAGADDVLPRNPG